jgi:hypothetical protein
MAIGAAIAVAGFVDVGDNGCAGAAIAGVAAVAADPPFMQEAANFKWVVLLLSAADIPFQVAAQFFIVSAPAAGARAGTARRPRAKVAETMKRMRHPILLDPTVTPNVSAGNPSQASVTLKNDI